MPGAACAGSIARCPDLAIVARTSSVILRLVSGSAACDTSSGFPFCRITVSISFSSAGRFAGSMPSGKAGLYSMVNSTTIRSFSRASGRASIFNTAGPGAFARMRPKAPSAMCMDTTRFSGAALPS